MITAKERKAITNAALVAKEAELKKLAALTMENIDKCIEFRAQRGESVCNYNVIVCASKNIPVTSRNTPLDVQNEVTQQLQALGYSVYLSQGLLCIEWSK